VIIKDEMMKSQLAQQQAGAGFARNPIAHIESQVET